MQISPELIILGLLGISYFYLFIYQYFAAKKCNYIHETGVAIIAGVLIGLPVFFFVPDQISNNKLQQICRNIIILILIPPMLFQDGYNIPKRKFFQNIFYINLYGIFGTILNFLSIYLILYLFNHYDLISLLWQSQTLHLSNFQIVMFSAVMCSIDTVVPQRIVNPQRYPKLFSIIFGQSIMKDTITFTLVSALLLIKNNSQNEQDLMAQDIGIIILDFLAVVAGSILIGIIYSIFTTILFKKCRFLLKQQGIAEIGLVMMTGYAAYVTGQYSKCSGVIAMLFCGIILSHFNIYNLTPQGKAASKYAITTLALISQGLLFCLLGAYITNIQASSLVDDTGSEISYYSFSWTFLLIGIMALIVGRFMNILIPSLIGRLLLGKKKWKVNKYQYQILFLSGLIKGAVPFALILTVPLNNKSSIISSQSMINTVIIIVFITSLFLNSLLPKMIRNRLKHLRFMIISNPDHPSVFDSMLVVHQERPRKSVQKYQGQIQLLNLYSKMKNTTQKYWRKCEQGFLKPHLIYDYHARKDRIREQKIKQRKKQCLQYWERLRISNILTETQKQSNILIDELIINNDQKYDDDCSDEIGMRKNQSLMGNKQQMIELDQKKYRSQNNFKFESISKDFQHIKQYKKSEE